MESRPIRGLMRLDSRLLVLVLLALLPALGLSCYAYYRQRQAEKARVQELAVAQARLVAVTQESLIKNCRQSLGTLGQLPFMSTAGNRPFLAGIMVNLGRLSPDYCDFGLAELDATVFTSAANTNGGHSLRGQPHFERVLQTKTFAVGGFGVDATTGQPTLGFGQPVFAADGQLRRIFYGTIKLAALAEAAAQIRLPENATLTVLDRDAVVVVREPGPDPAPGKSLAADPLARLLRERGEGVFELAAADGSPDLVALAPVGNPRDPALWVSLRLPASALFAAANRMLFQGFILLVVVALAVLLAARIYARRYLIAPMQALVATARRLGRGDFSARTGLGADESELHDLGRVVDDMAATLQRRQQEIDEANAEIRKINASLEQHVKDRTAQLEYANAELEAFTYSTSHDLRAPLRHIAGFANMLRNHAGAQLDDKSQRYVNIIADSARRMGCLIDDLLVFSRVGRQEITHARVSSVELVTEVIKELELETAGRKIEWTIGALPEVRGDASLLRQVWRNLIQNAVKYTKPRAVARIEIGVSEESDEKAIFFVRDNGVGFEMKYADKLFGVFQRLHKDTEFEGTGIGLANVRRIVTRHGGKTAAQGELNVGATFSFSLPKYKPGAE